MPDSSRHPDPPAGTGPATPVAAPDAVAPNLPAAADDAGRLALRRRFPTAHDLRARARRRLPRFAFEYADGGAGADGGIARNWAALDAIELVPRYGRVAAPPPTDAEILGRRYAAPFGIAPIGGPGTAYPGAETHFARAAQAANVPYVMGVLSGLDLDRAGALAPDVLWLQMYRFAKNGHRIGLDLVRRADAAGVNVLVLTLDTPVRTTRPREVRSGILHPFRMTLGLRWAALRSPHWLAAMLRSGIPRFVPLAPYLPPGATTDLARAAAFIRDEQGGAFTWDEIALYRDAWKKPLVLKGIVHPADAERAAALGIDGVVVTSHGGRQIEALPAAVDAVPAVRAAVGDRLSVLFDSGVRSGVDVARAIAVGADAAFAGKSFLWSLGALGPAGPGHLIDLLTQDLAATLGQTGCNTVADLRSLTVRHPGAYAAADFGDGA